MFGTKKAIKAKKDTGEHNVIVLDIESSSVGAALAHVRPGQAPVLFAESRTHFAVPHSLQGSEIARQVERATHELLLKLGHVAATLRGNPSTASRGSLTHANVFLSAPWGTPNLAAGKPDFSPRMQTFLAQEVSALAPDASLQFYTGADAVVYGSALHTQGETTLLALVRGEITELVLVGEGGPLGYATLPMGSRSLYRTLQTHAGLSLAEMPAVLAFANTAGTPYREPLDAAGLHMLEHFAPGLEALVHAGTPAGIVVVAEKGVAEWFARILESDDSLGALFAPDATVRTLGAHHVAKHLGGHGTALDLHLGLGALFTTGKLKAAFN